MSISRSDSQKPSEDNERDSKDSFEPSLAVLKENEFFDTEPEHSA
jgi:hypothetical protein